MLKGNLTRKNLTGFLHLSYYQNLKLGQVKAFREVILLECSQKPSPQAVPIQVRETEVKSLTFFRQTLIVSRSGQHSLNLLAVKRRSRIRMRISMLRN